jgi:hypothetical protein
MADIPNGRGVPFFRGPRSISPFSVDDPVERADLVRFSREVEPVRLHLGRTGLPLRKGDEALSILQQTEISIQEIAISAVRPVSDALSDLSTPAKLVEIGYHAGVNKILQELSLFDGVFRVGHIG